MQTKAFLHVFFPSFCVLCQQDGGLPTYTIADSWICYFHFFFVCHRSQLQTMTGAPLKNILHNISPRCSAQSKCWNDVKEILAKTIGTLKCGVCMCLARHHFRTLLIGLRVSVLEGNGIGFSLQNSRMCKDWSEFSDKTIIRSIRLSMHTACSFHCITHFTLPAKIRGGMDSRLARNAKLSQQVAYFEEW